LLKFAISFTKTVYSRLEPIARDNWKGFKMAAHHGPAILIRKANTSSDSIISLGPAANAPAKRLPKTRAKYLALPSDFLKQSGVAHQDEGGWIEINVHDVSGPYTAFESLVLNEQLGAASRAVLAQRVTSLPSRVRLAKASQFSESAYASVAHPLKVQGLCMRADLDGFSKQVSRAFEAGEPGMRALAERFYTIMSYGDDYAAKLQERVIQMPWAGDCATLVLVSEESYARIRGYLPATAAAKWHDQMSERGRNWGDSMGTSRWAVGVAGGDDEEGADGYMLLARVTAGGRGFLVGAGWGVGRSLDAKEAEGVRGGDTVVPDVDYDALEPVYQKHFEPLDSVFWKSSGLSGDKLVQSAVQAGSVSKEKPTTYPNIIIPAPRPHWNDLA
jgi:hypothetical protein